MTTRPTTYEELTAAAARNLALALAHSIAAQPVSQQQVREDIVAHRDLSAALAHLGTRLLRLPTAATPRATAQAEAAGQLITQLAGAGHARDWLEPSPNSPTATALIEAARHVRTAADLMATHHDPDGRPRSPQSQDLANPEVREAALIDWNQLVGASAKTAATLRRRALDQGLERNSGEPVTRYPLPSHVLTPRQPESVLAVPVARPAIRTRAGGLTELADRVSALRQRAWSMAQRGEGTPQVLRNLAAIGTSLNTLTANTAHAAAAQSVPGPERDLHTGNAVAATRAADAWRTTSSSLTYLRSSDRLDPLIELDRMRINRLIDQVAKLPAHQTAGPLARISAGYDQVADWSALALLRSHERGDLHVAGAGLPASVTATRPEIARARIQNRLSPTPIVVVERAQEAFLGVTSVRTPAQSLAPEPPGL